MRKIIVILGLVLLLSGGQVMAMSNAILTMNTQGYYDQGIRSEYAQFNSFPGLYVNGQLINPMGDENLNVSLDFDNGYQEWTLLAEYSGWKDKNYFGYCTQSGEMSTVFSGFDSAGESAYTNIPAGEEIGLWLKSDLNMDGVTEENEPFLSSRRDWVPTMYTRHNNYQYFYVYDMKEYKNTRSAYDFVNDHEDFATSGNYDYLIYIDDSGVYSTDSDHNDMILGITTVIPEPATMILLGMGLVGIGITRRRKRI